MQSVWGDFVAQRTVIKQMVSPRSTAERGLYMSWGETGYATQESALHWVAVPTHLLHDLVWRVCLPSQSALTLSPQPQRCAHMAHSNTGAWLMPLGAPSTGVLGTRDPLQVVFFYTALLGRFHPA